MTAFTIPLPIYQCHKRVSALKIKAVVPSPRGYELHFEDERFVPILVGTEWLVRLLPSDKGYNYLVGGYLVVYEDGYQSWSPAAAFEAGYTLVEEACAIGPATQAAVAADLARHGITVDDDQEPGK